VTVLLVRVPPGYEAERRYAVDVVLGTILGLEYRLEPYAGTRTQLVVAGDEDGRSLSVVDGLFATASEDWSRKRSLPTLPLQRWQAAIDLPDAVLAADGLPVLFGTAMQGHWLRDSDTGIDLGVDVFGSAFFLLTRYEELVSSERDCHGRFPAAASLASHEGFLDRPIVDEYAEIVWACLRRLFPSLERRPRSGRVLLSHDVDWPFSPRAGPLATLRGAAVDALKLRSPHAALARLRGYVARRRGDKDADPHNTFDGLMDLAERHGLRTAFYFIAERTAGALDGEYELDDPWIRDLIRRVHERGHEVGLHPSYGSYREPGQIAKEFAKLRATADSLGVEQEEWGGRQHFLRWEVGTTWPAWDEAGLAYDSSLGYAERVGFRSGTCHEHRTFDLRTGAELALRERPLMVMDATLLEGKYMGLDHDEATERARGLRETCLRFGGDFTLLWHNSYLRSPAAWGVLDGILA